MLGRAGRESQFWWFFEGGREKVAWKNKVGTKKKSEKNGSGKNGTKKNGSEKKVFFKGIFDGIFNGIFDGIFKAIFDGIFENKRFFFLTNYQSPTHEQTKHTKFEPWIFLKIKCRNNKIKH